MKPSRKVWFGFWFKNGTFVILNTHRGLHKTHFQILISSSYPTICRIAAPVNDKACVRCRFLLCSLPLPIPSVFASFWLHDLAAIVAAAGDSFCLCFFLALLWSLLLPLPSRLLTLLWSLVTGPEFS